MAGTSRFQFTKIRVAMKQGGKTIIEKIGGHPTGNPGKSAVVLANLRRATTGLEAGTFIVTGSFTGFHPVALNEPVTGASTSRAPSRSALRRTTWRAPRAFPAATRVRVPV